MNTKQKENYLRYNTNLKLKSERIRQHSEVEGGGGINVQKINIF